MSSRPGSRPWERPTPSATPARQDPAEHRSRSGSAFTDALLPEAADATATGPLPASAPEHPRTGNGAGVVAPDTGPAQGPPPRATTAARPTLRPTPSRQRRVPRGVALALVVVGVCAVAAGSLIALFGGRSEPEQSLAEGLGPMLTTSVEVPATSPAPPTAGPAAVDAVPAEPVCPATAADGVWTGNGPGGTESGPAAIFGFEYAYYVERDGARARTFVADGAAVGSAEVLQRVGIDTIPTGTTHCLRITERAPDEFGVQVTQTTPGAPAVVFNQIARTRTEAGRTLVISIIDVLETEQ